MHHVDGTLRSGRLISRQTMALVVAGCVGAAVVMGFGQFATPAQAESSARTAACPTCGGGGVPALELRDGSVALVGGADGQFYIVTPGADAVEVRAPRRERLFWR